MRDNVIDLRADGNHIWYYFTVNSLVKADNVMISCYKYKQIVV